MLLTRSNRFVLTARNSHIGQTIVTRIEYIEDKKTKMIFDDFSISTDSLINQRLLPQFSGQLISISVQAQSPDTMRGETWVQIGTLEGANIGNPRMIKTFVADYVTSENTLMWPVSQITNPRSAGGAFGSISVPNPAAGANFSFIIPNGRMFNPIKSITIIFTSDATVANRQLNIRFFEAGSILLAVHSPVSQVASNTVRHSFFGSGSPPANLGNYMYSPLPDITLDSRHTITSDIVNIQAADQISFIIISGNLQTSDLT